MKKTCKNLLMKGKGNNKIIANWIILKLAQYFQVQFSD